VYLYNKQNTETACILLLTQNIIEKQIARLRVLNAFEARIALYCVSAERKRLQLQPYGVISHFDLVESAAS